MVAATRALCEREAAEEAARVADLHAQEVARLQHR